MQRPVLMLVIFCFAVRLGAVNVEDYCKSIKPDVPVRCVTFAGHMYAVAEVDLRRMRISTAVTPKGQTQDYPTIFAELRKRGESRAVITNAGIYGTDAKPLGLLITAGKIVNDLNENSGSGNFYDHSAVFATFRDDTAAVVSTSEWKSQSPAFSATQSGPQLLGNGQARFSKNSAYRYTRTAVGVTQSDRHIVRIVVSREPVTLFELQQFMSQAIHCSEALHLDGDLSALFVAGVPPKYLFADPGSRIATFMFIAAK
ncbi:MAG TPA: phosphodiester glycosidase family protein [Candidatus Angelobacter sp.]|nr:phosphodiester glycosidase family protein [Candidatus Angelobacter sp.]